MRSYIFFMLPGLLLLATACNKGNTDPSQPLEIKNVSYGAHPQQNMDLYLPAGRNENTKIFILVHGGGWSTGSKEDFNYAIPFLKTYFPAYAVVNINYRLGTAADPGYPKQTDDIGMVIQHLKDHREEYQVSSTFAFFGSSAGGHLALLYSYKYDTGHDVKAVCSMVGPTDLTDPSYVNNPVYEYAAAALVGPQTYPQNPALYAEASPVTHVVATSPKTLLFYGDADELVPATQGGILHNKLNSVGVYNEFYLYPGEGHGGWNEAHSIDFQQKLVSFFSTYF